MYLVEDKAGAIALMLLALCLLGTWPAILNSLERRGRSLQHTYIDYSIANCVGAVIIASLLGQREFLDQFSQRNLPSVGFAMAGGLVLSVGNLATQYAWPFVGISATGVISSSIAVVFGTTINFFLDARMNRAEILFPGIGCFLIAVFLGSLLHASNSEDNMAKMEVREGDDEETGYFLCPGNAEKSHLGEENVNFLQGENPGSSKREDADGCFTQAESGEKSSPDSETLNFRHGGRKSEKFLKQGENVDNFFPDSETLSFQHRGKHVDDSSLSGPEFGAPNFLAELDEQRAVKIGSTSFIFGLGIVFFAGLCFALFSPAFNLATNDQLEMLEPGVPKLLVYSAFFYFSIAAFLFGVVANVVLLYFPVMGLPESNLRKYVEDWDGRWWALLAGTICSVGNGFQFMGGQAAGYAAANAVQALPLVSTFWGVLIFKEYHQSSKKTYGYLVCMIIMFLTAVILLASSAGHRGS